MTTASPTSMTAMATTPTSNASPSIANPSDGSTGRTGPIGASGESRVGDAAAVARAEHDGAECADEPLGGRHQRRGTERMQDDPVRGAATQQATDRLPGDEQQDRGDDRTEHVERDRVRSEDTVGGGDRRGGSSLLDGQPPWQQPQDLGLRRGHLRRTAAQLQHRDRWVDAAAEQRPGERRRRDDLRLDVGVVDDEPERRRDDANDVHLLVERGDARSGQPDWRSPTTPSPKVDPTPTCRSRAAAAVTATSVREPAAGRRPDSAMSRFIR